MAKNKMLTYISLFSNAGIGCYGFKQEGFECIATNEILEERLKLQRFNNKCKYDTGYICGDITLESTKSKVFSEIKLWRKKENIKDIDVIIATPPCQGMSVANHKKKDELKRNSLVMQSIELTRKIKPKFFIFENVRTFLTTLCSDLDGTLKPIKDAIEHNLSDYNILYSIIDFKLYGNPSSRTRTLVLGVRKDLSDITPYDIFPNKETGFTLRQAIGSLKSLSQMGEIDPSDIYHNFRSYPEHMLSWIRDLKEGQSAFENKELAKRPHQVVDGKIVLNKNKNGDKYRRCFWNRPGYCIHTRNDQLASQMTIHPQDNRVFSIRELMTLMSIPSDFRWANMKLDELNALSYDNKRKFLKKEELNIRRTIGESVPPVIFRKIAKRIKNTLQCESLDDKSIKNIISSKKLHIFDNLYNFIRENLNTYSYPELSKIAELANSKRLNNAAYYTPQDVCYTIVKDLPDFRQGDSIRILEPSVGLGNFIPLIIKKYENCKSIVINVVDIDPDSIKLLKLLMRKIILPSAFKIQYIVADFLSSNTTYAPWTLKDKYDIVIGNPPFKKITQNQELLKHYKESSCNKDTNNTFSFFIERSLRVGKNVALIVPKSLLAAPEFNKTRDLMAKFKIKKLCDYGERAFRIKIETVSFIIDTMSSEKKTENNIVKIESYITKDIKSLRQSYICSRDYPYWLIYRNTFFDEVADKLVFDIFMAFRDRQITNKILLKSGRYRVLKSRNIGNTTTKRNPGQDRYINDIESLNIKKILNRKNVILIPNLTYLPRASFLPRNCITDGSVAIAQCKNGHRVKRKDLKLYKSEEFTKFYRIARNMGSRTMNIDSNSIFFFGKKKSSKN